MVLAFMEPTIHEGFVTKIVYTVQKNVIRNVNCVSEMQGLG